MKKYHADIIGMTCENCVRAIRNRLASTAGITVDDVQVGSIDIGLDESKVSTADVEELVSDEGYTVGEFTAR